MYATYFLPAGQYKVLALGLSGVITFKTLQAVNDEVMVEYIGEEGELMEQGNFSHTLTKLVRMGLIRKIAHGQYELTSQGRECIQDHLAVSLLFLKHSMSRATQGLPCSLKNLHKAVELLT